LAIKRLTQEQVVTTYVLVLMLVAAHLLVVTIRYWGRVLG
jgi:hypothetical protein